MTGNMIITSGHTSASHVHTADEVHCPFPGPHCQPYSYSGYTASCLGKAHIICGSVCFVLEILGLGVDLDNHRAAPGIWCGLLFICAGVVSVMCGKRNTKDWIKSSLVMTSVAAIFSAGPLINCSLATGNFGARFLCWMLMAATTAELIVALSNIVICIAAISPQHFHLIGLQMMVPTTPQPSDRVPDTFQVMYMPPTTGGGSFTGQEYSMYSQHPQCLRVDPPGLQPPTCVVIPPTPSPPLPVSQDSTQTPCQEFNCQ